MVRRAPLAQRAERAFDGNTFIETNLHSNGRERAVKMLRLSLRPLPMIAADGSPMLRYSVPAPAPPPNG
jgi:hypothetical protein